MPATKISKWMPKATVAIEDRRFYEHNGVDVEGIARAAFKNLSEQRVVEGGSTITQQLVRNLYISRERTVERKLKEACLAIKLDRAWSKQRILTSYMNQVYYGNHAYGIEAAARTYFSRAGPRADAEAGGADRGPAAGAVDLRPDPPARARARPPRRGAARDVHDRGRSTPSQYNVAVADRDLGSKPGKLYQRIREPYFFRTSTTSSSRSTAARPFARAGCASTRRSTGGCRSPRGARSSTRSRTRPIPPSAVVSIDPRIGAISAMVAVTPNSTKNQYNLVSQGGARPARRSRRSSSSRPSSAASIRTRRTTGRSLHLPARSAHEAGSVKTYDHSYRHDVDLARDARSDNTVFAQLTLDLGAGGRSRRCAQDGRHRAEVGGRAGDGARRDLGLAARDGVRVRDARRRWHLLGADGDPEGRAPRRQERQGRRLGRAEAQARAPDWVAYEVTRILEENVQSGTGVGAQIGARRRARRARRTTTPTRGSRVHAAARRRPSGSAIRRRRSRWRTCTGSRSPVGRSPPTSGGASCSSRWRTGRIRVAPAEAQPGVEAVRAGASTRSTYVDAAGPAARTPPRPPHPAPPPSAPPPAPVAPPPPATHRHRRRRPRRRLRRRPCLGLSRPDGRTRLAPGPRRPRLRRGLHRARVARTTRRSSRSRAARSSATTAGRGRSSRCSCSRSSRTSRAARARAGGGCRFARVVVARSRCSSCRSARRSCSRATPGRTGCTGGSPSCTTGTRTRTRRRRLPDDPAYQYAGEAWRDSTSVYAPGFTLASEPLALAAGESADAAAWIYKTLAGARRRARWSSCCRAARGATRARGRVRRLEPAARGPPRRRRAQRRVDRCAAARCACRRGAPAAAWALGRSRRSSGSRSCFCRCTRSRRGRAGAGSAPGFALTRPSSFALATWRYGFAWLGAFGPLADNARETTSYALPHRLSQLGVPEDAAIALFARSSRRRLRGGSRGRHGAAVRGSRSRRSRCSRARRTSRRGTSRGSSRSPPSRRTARARPRARVHGVPAAADDSRLNTSTPSSSKTSRQFGSRRRRRDRDRVWARGEPVEIAGRPLVDRDPGRVLADREAEEAAARGEVRAERVRRGHDGVVGDQPERSRRDAVVVADERRARLEVLRRPGSPPRAGSRPSTKFATSTSATSGADRRGARGREDRRREERGIERRDVVEVDRRLRVRRREQVEREVRERGQQRERRGEREERERHEQARAR